MRKTLVFLLSIIALCSFATHNRSGYISYCWVGPNTYHFRIFTYTNYQSVSADRCDQTLFFSDTQGNLGDSLVCPRTNGSAPCPNGGSGVDGVQIVPPSGGYGGVKENIYEGTIVLNAGVYVVTMIDPNRDAGIVNMGGANSQNIAFALVDTVYIYNFVGVRTNCTPTVTNPPIQNACASQPWCYNPGMIDPENDSLVFSICKSYEDNPGQPPGGVQPIPVENIPSNMSVDPLTGTLCWTPVASLQGEYNVALLIKEYRKNPIDSRRYLVNETVFDIQILVVGCSNPGIDVSQPPNICLEAGQNYSVTVTASVTPGGSAVTPLHLSATGLPFTGANFNHATFVSTPGNPATGTFNWTPNCLAVQQNPYYVTFQGSDSNTPLANANFSTFNIRVVSPPPTNVLASPQGSSVNLTWAAPVGCGQTTGNRITKYLIYRNDSCNPYVPTPCQTGVPSNSGYSFIGTTSASTLSFTDNNFGSGLVPGNSYSYLVVAQFTDGSLSMASSSTSNTCVKLKLDVPLMMKVSVDTTDAAVGRILVAWKNPFTDSNGLDTTLGGNTGPYKYVLQRKAGAGSFVPVYTVTETYFHWLRQTPDTTFTDSNIDTQTKQFFYKVDFYAAGGNSFIGTAASAGSIFLTAAPHDKKVNLSWSVSVPWTNVMYYILKQRYGGPTDAYDIIDSTTSTSYVVKNLVNGYNYCFKVLAKGLYADNKVNPQPPLSRYTMNYSEKVCSTPFDDEAPCQPALSIGGDGTCSLNTLVWTDPNHTCGINDVVKYYIYYTPFKDSALVLIDSLNSSLDTIYVLSANSASIAGCYVIVAVDSAGNKSPLTNESCIDYCPEYELPNIFTPNADNLNDTYIPVKNKYIKSVEFTMYNRWGNIVFETKDPALKWDGKSQQMKQMVSDGTYYYICKVNELHYYGIKSYTLKGFVTILH